MQKKKKKKKQKQIQLQLLTPAEIPISSMPTLPKSISKTFHIDLGGDEKIVVYKRDHQTDTLSKSQQIALPQNNPGWFGYISEVGKLLVPNNQGSNLNLFVLDK